MALNVIPSGPECKKRLKCCFILCVSFRIGSVPVMPLRCSNVECFVLTFFSTDCGSPGFRFSLFSYIPSRGNFRILRLKLEVYKYRLSMHTKLLTQQIPDAQCGWIIFEEVFWACICPSIIVINTTRRICFRFPCFRPLPLQQGKGTCKVLQLW